MVYIRPTDTPRISEQWACDTGPHAMPGSSNVVPDEAASNALSETWTVRPPLAAPKQASEKHIVLILHQMAAETLKHTVLRLLISKSAPWPA